MFNIFNELIKIGDCGAVEKVLISAMLYVWYIYDIFSSMEAIKC
jgi:hypothetical protein